jgi:hypothetical protein
MAGVPQYGEPRVNLNGPNDVEFRTPDTSGFAENGRQLQRAGATIEQGGEQLGKIFQAEQEKANDLRVIDAENQARESAIKLAVDKDEGYTNVKGGDVMDVDGQPLADTYRARFQQRISDITSNLSNEAQRQAFARSAAVLDGEFYAKAKGYEADQYGGWQQSVVKGSSELAAQEIALNYNDPEFIDKRLGTLDVSVEKLGRLQGMSGDEIAALNNTARSEALTQAMSTALDSGDTATARQLFTRYGDRLLAPDRSKIEGPLKREEALMVGQTYGEDYVRGLLGGNAVGGVVPTMAADGKADPATVWQFVAAHEGGFAAHDANGAPVNFGINQSANPGVNVKTLTKDQAEQIFTTKYWNKSGAANLPPAMAAIHADTYFINPAQAQKFLKASGNDPAKYMQMRQAWMQSLIAKEPGKFGKFQKAWSSRNRDLVAFAANLAGGGTNPATGKPNMTLEDAIVAARTKLMADHPDATPDMVKAVESSAESTWRIHDQSVDQNIEKGTSTAYQQLLQNGGDVSKLDPSLRNSLPGDKWASVLAFADTVKSYNKDKRDPVEDDKMYNYAITHPEVIRDASPSVFLSHYAGHPKFEEIAKYRAQLRGELPLDKDGKNDPGTLSYTTINNIVDSRLTAAGVALKDGKGHDNPAIVGQVGAVRRVINGLIAGEQRRIGRPMNDTELESFVDRQFARPGVIHTRNFLGVTTAQTAIPLFAVDVGHIPPADLKQIDDALDRAGQPKTDANRLSLYYAGRTR